ncbi:tetratricopeptide repeat protein [Duganella sp.]|uniref:tetratricopeptide repeat protein n=1 Tax=Duganella sp. TaxID=1904440 RepID=UPI0031DFE6BA
MSLINKMLQDLDARGGAAASAVHQDEVKAVPSREGDRRPLLLGGAAAGVLVLAAAGWYGWHWWQARSAPPPVQMARVVDTRIPIQPRFQPPPAPKSAATANRDEVASGAERATSAAEAGKNHGEPAADHGSAAPAGESAAAEMRKSRRESAAGDIAAAGMLNGRREPATGGVTGEEAPAKRAARPTRVAGDADAAAAPSRKTRAAAATSPAADGVVLRELTPKQISENSYRRALLALQEGRVSAALADLDKAVEVDPRNDAARQTYVSLLLENKRTDDAIRQLRLALGVDPRQPGLAMVLARLQLEKGGPALETLLKTLPYAGDNADYHAFLAGVLQREQRHTEAAEHYRQALQMSPQNAVWWMGLGISLQAEQHLPEAREAYNRARSNPGLTPELRGFVERKLEQLSR